MSLWGAALGYLSLDGRAGHPAVRDGSYVPSLLSPRRCAERALLTVVQDAYLAGVSTARVDALVEALGIASRSKSGVGRICAAHVAEVDPDRISTAGCAVAPLTGGSARPPSRNSRQTQGVRETCAQCQVCGAAAARRTMDDPAVAYRVGDAAAGGRRVDAKLPGDEIDRDRPAGC